MGDPGEGSRVNPCNRQACLFRLDSSRIGEDDPVTTQAHGRPLVLLLEDEALIAITLQDDLQDAGYEVAGPFVTCAAALEWLGTETPNTAILDAALKDGPCREIALELSRRGVPFLIYSGHHEDR